VCVCVCVRACARVIMFSSVAKHFSPSSTDFSKSCDGLLNKAVSTHSMQVVDHQFRCSNATTKLKGCEILLNVQVN
jgi:hypothetical protein